MAKKKKVSKDDLISGYMEYVLTNGEQPKTVYAFAQDNHFDEALFYKYFSSFNNLEASIFNAFFDNTITLLDKSKDYQTFDARNKLLSFYFTFFENLTANRSYVVHVLNQHKSSLKCLRVLSELRGAFTAYIENLDIELIDSKQEQINRIQRRGLKESAWFQLLMTIKFWIDDTSKNFEKTDIFIEKSVNTSFDILNVVPLNSIIDLGKFMFKEKVKMN